MPKRDADADDESELQQLLSRVTADETTSASKLATAPSEPRAAKSNETNGGAPSLGGLAGVSVQTTPAGGLRIEAPPELAAPLAQIFASLAASLSAVAESNAEGRPRR